MLNINKVITEKISFQDIQKNFKYNLSLILISFNIFSFGIINLFSFIKLNTPEFFFSLYITSLITLSFFVFLFNNLDKNFLKSFNKKEIKKNPKQTIFNFLKKDIDFFFFIAHQKELEEYFKKNDCEELYFDFIKEKFKKENNIYYDNIPDEFYSLIDNQNIICSKNLTKEKLKTSKHLMTSVIDYWIEIESELINKIDNITLKSLKYDLITKNIDSFIELGNINTENGRKVYDYLKSNNINNKYTHIFEQEVLFLNNLSKNFLNELNQLNSVSSF